MMHLNMFREDIINEGRPVEPYCFENDREELWYNIGLYDGATSDTWHNVSAGAYPPIANPYTNISCDVLVSDGTKYSVGCYYKDMNKWKVVGYDDFHVVKWQRIIN